MASVEEGVGLGIREWGMTLRWHCSDPTAAGALCSLGSPKKFLSGGSSRLKFGITSGIITGMTAEFLNKRLGWSSRYLYL